MEKNIKYIRGFCYEDMETIILYSKSENSIEMDMC